MCTQCMCTYTQQNITVFTGIKTERRLGVRFPLLAREGIISQDDEGNLFDVSHVDRLHIALVISFRCWGKLVGTDDSDFDSRLIVLSPYRPLLSPPTIWPRRERVSQWTPFRIQQNRSTSISAFALLPGLDFSLLDQEEM